MGVNDTEAAGEDENARRSILGDKPILDCFFCGSRILGTFTFWVGYVDGVRNNPIHFHSHCARNLAQHLIRDGMNAADLDKKAYMSAHAPRTPRSIE